VPEELERAPWAVAQLNPLVEPVAASGQVAGELELRYRGAVPAY
jgi:hypothetical protein